MLGLHVVLGAMLGAALGAHNESVFMQQEAKYAPRCYQNPSTSLVQHAIESPFMVLHSWWPCLFALDCAVFSILSLCSSPLLGKKSAVLNLATGTANTLLQASNFGKHPRAIPKLLHSMGSFAHQLVLASIYTPSRFFHCCLCRCNQWQRASAGCTDFCACANTNTCTRSQLSAPTCAGCTAWPVEFCNDFRSNRIIIGIIVSALPAVQTVCYVICILCDL